MEKPTNPSLIEDSTERLTFLTDGVFAIVMTLLVLELRVPELGHAELDQLPHALSSLWPSVTSFIISFVVLGLFWTAHHTEFKYIKKLDHKLIWLNLFYLLLICFIPFSAALLGRYYTEQLSIVIYAGNLLLATVFHYVMWRHATRRHRLVDSWIDPRLVSFGSYMSYYSACGYALAILASFWHPYISIFLLAVIPIPFILGTFYRIIREELT